MSQQFFYNHSSMDLYLLTNASLTASDTVVFAKETEILIVSGTSSTEKVERMMFEDLQFQYSAIDFSACLAGSCMDQSASFLSTATVHTMNANSIVFDGVHVSEPGGYGVWLDHGTT